ncbi:MAG: hypothetical protein R3E67_05985 [Pseudomonadales bacterium]
MKIAGLLLACALPFTANAADVCLKVNDQMYLKFKKPALTKGTASQFTGTFVVPAAGMRPVMYAPAFGLAVTHSDGKIDYTVNADTYNSFWEYYDSSAKVGFVLVNTDKKTFSSGTMAEWGGAIPYAYLYDATLDEDILDTQSVQLSAVNCKEVPAF